MSSPFGSKSVPPGLVHLTRLHSIRSQSDPSLITTSDLSSNFNSGVYRDRSWSWKYLRNESKTRDVEKLFCKYQARLQHNFFMVSLVLNSLFNLAAIVVYFYYKESNDFPDLAVIRLTSLLVFICFLVLTLMDEQWLRPRVSRTLAATTVLIAMIFAEHGGALLAIVGETDDNYLLQRVRPTYYIILANHIFLPFPSRMHGAVGTIVVVFLELLVTVLSRLQSQCPTNLLVRYALADLVFYVISGGVGFILTLLLEIATRKAFLDHRSCVESKLKLDHETEQQNQLLSSCLPLHLTDRVRSDIEEVIKSMKADKRFSSKPFNELYVEKYKDVSILYADIVNSVVLAQKLTANDLVETLNELYGRFDEYAEKTNCMRIKLLGDCYYCVSGIPEHDDNHAVNCVRMGLKMIRIIHTVRTERDLLVDMRIGVHSGMVLSGLLGLHKWQYDIWSYDCKIASSMEQKGRPGYVHCSRTTMNLIPGDAKKDFLIEEQHNEDGESTYFISAPKEFYEEEDLNSPSTRRKGHAHKLTAQIYKLRRKSSIGSTIISNRERMALVETIHRYREMLKTVNIKLEETIEDMPLGKKVQWFQPEGINPICLNFMPDRALGPNFWTVEKRFATQRDPLFKHYLHSVIIICIALLIMKLISTNFQIPLKVALCIATTFGVTAAGLFVAYRYKHRLTYAWRISIWLATTISLVVCSSIDMMRDDCKAATDAVVYLDCAASWYHVFCFTLALTSISLFIRINLWFKFVLSAVTVLVFVSIVLTPCSIFAVAANTSTKWSFLGYSPQTGQLYYIITVALLTHIIDRQIEYILRLDFLWTKKLEIERKEALAMGEINQILLENILPIHVAERYLYSSMSAAGQLYHEAYDSVTVMFASIPNYIDFYTETSINDEGLKCLQLLNEIICDFDKLLSHVCFPRIEKIKTIGSTYMAAAGLQPGRGSTDSEVSVEDVTCNVVQLVRFATAMMETLQRINKDALQDFRLRLGISVGPVIAGIVGAVKPQYDIWGDTVNMASRLESTGIPGRIHVTKEVARVLSECGAYQTECRGMTAIKGKGELLTYLVQTPFDFEEVNCTRI